MRTIFLEDIGVTGKLKSGYIDLFDRGGNKYRREALFVPGYEWVPCSRKLCEDYTDEAKSLALVIIEEEDKNSAFSSPIWITRPKVTFAGTWDEVDDGNNTSLYVSEFFEKHKIKEGKRLFSIKTCRSVIRESNREYMSQEHGEFCLGLARGFDSCDKPIYSYFIYPSHLAALFGGFDSKTDFKCFLKENHDFIKVVEPDEDELFGTFYSTLYNYDF